MCVFTSNSIYTCLVLCMHVPSCLYPASACGSRLSSFSTETSQSFFFPHLTQACTERGYHLTSYLLPCTLSPDCVRNAVRRNTSHCKEGISTEIHIHTDTLIHHSRRILLQSYILALMRSYCHTPM